MRLLFSQSGERIMATFGSTDFIGHDGETDSHLSPLFSWPFPRCKESLPAWFGQFAELLAAHRVGPSGKIESFNPTPSDWDELKKRANTLKGRFGEFARWLSTDSPMYQTKAYRLNNIDNDSRNVTLKPEIHYILTENKRGEIEKLLSNSANTGDITTAEAEFCLSVWLKQSKQSNFVPLPINILPRLGEPRSKSNQFGVDWKERRKDAFLNKLKAEDSLIFDYFDYNFIRRN